MKKQNPITQKDLETYFQKTFGKSIDELLGPESFFRYTKEGHDMLVEAISHYTNWNFNTQHGLYLTDSNDPRALLVHPKVSRLSDLPDLTSFLGKINELRSDAELHHRLMQKGIEEVFEKEEKQELEDRIELYLKETKNTNLDEYLSQKEPQRSTNINALLKEFAQTEIINNDVYTIDYNGEVHRQTNEGCFELSVISSKDHLIDAVYGSRLNRDEFYFQASRYVRKNKPISREEIENKVRENLDMEFEDIINGKNISASQRTKMLNKLHFYFSEVYQDREGDMIFPNPHDESKTVAITDIENPKDYFQNISSVHEFIEKLKHARTRRDRYFEIHERAQNDPELKTRLDAIRKRVEREEGEQEREER